MTTTMINDQYRQLLEAKGIFFSDKTCYTDNEVALLFPGHGSQYEGMLRMLDSFIPAAKETLDKANRVYMSLSGELLTSNWTTSKINDAIVLQPSLFAASMVMYSFLESQNICSNCMLGHSLGEIAALCASGSISFEDGLTICYCRAKALDYLSPDLTGRMVSVQGTQNDKLITDFLSQNPNSRIGIINAPTQYVVSGTVAEMEALVQLCKKNNITNHLLPIPYPFHSPLLTEVSKSYFKAIQNIEFRPNKVPVYSTILGRFYDANDFYGSNIASILASQLTNPFNFINSINDIYKAGYKVFVECGPNNILSKLTEKILSDSPKLIMYTNSSHEDTMLSIAKFLAKYNLNVYENTKGLGDNDMKTILINTISIITGYPIKIIKQYIENCNSGNYVQELAINSFAEKEILSRLEGTFRESNLNSVIKENYLSADNAILELSPNSQATTIDDIVNYLKKVISQKTGYPVELLDNNADLEADLGIDSVKQAEIIGKVREYYDYELDSDVKVKDYPNIKSIAEYVLVRLNNDCTLKTENLPYAPVAHSGVTTDEVVKIIKDTVSEKTGYPVELLDNEADLEADLGIDSVKQAEIFGKVREYYDYELDSNVKIRDYPNIKSIAKYVSSRLNADNTVSDTPIAHSIVTLHSVVEIIKNMISEKTGYPVELLDNEADLEADLGIDSVKQAEIIGKVREHYGYELDTNVKIKDYPNIIMIAKYVVARVNTNMDSQKKNSNANIEKDTIIEPDEYHTFRYSASTTFAGLENESIYELSNKRILVIADQVSGIYTKNIVTSLKKNNVISVVGEKGDYRYISDFTDENMLYNVFNCAIKDMGGLDCVINLQALLNAATLSEYNNVYDFETAYKKIYNGLFYSAKSCYSFFESDDNCAYFAATNIGNYFGVESNELNNSLGAITTGFLKALEKELRPFITKVIDIDLDDMSEDIVSNLLLKEFSHYTNHLEIGYENNTRKRIITQKNPISNISLDVNPIFDAGDSLLITGGGRGITYECAKALLETMHKPIHVYITGRTPVPKGDEMWLEMSEDELETYKSTYMIEKKRENSNLKALEIQQEFNKLKNARSLNANLQALKHGGHTIEYIRCDFSNEEDVRSLSNALAKRINKIVGIINGAGLPSFGKVPRKNEKAAYKVLQLKANSMYFINKYFINSGTKFIINMGSISGRFGMDGQVDYSAAADLLVKLSKEITHNTKCKCITLGWPAWDSVGMASSAEVMKVQKEDRGLTYISVKEGCTQFLKELCSLDNSKCEYLYFGNLGELNMPLGQLEYEKSDVLPVESNVDTLSKEEFPLIDHIIKYNNNMIKIKRELDIRTDQHLQEHKVDGNSVLAGVYHIEMACEIFKLYNKIMNKSYEVSTISDYNFYEFIKYFHGNPLTVSAVGEVISETDDELIMKIQLKSDFINKNGIVLRKDRLHSEGIIIGKKVITIDLQGFPELKNGSQELVMKSVDIRKYYENGEQFIFFGEHFRNVDNVKIAQYKDYITGNVKVADEGKVFCLSNGINSIISPIVIDNIGRLMLLNEFDKYGYSIVPTQISSAQKVRDFKPNEILHVICEKVGEEGDAATYNATAYDDNWCKVFIINRMTLTRIDKIGGDHNIKL